MGHIATRPLLSNPMHSTPTGANHGTLSDDANQLPCDIISHICSVLRFRLRELCCYRTGSSVRLDCVFDMQRTSLGRRPQKEPGEKDDREPHYPEAIANSDEGGEDQPKCAKSKRRDTLAPLPRSSTLSRMEARVRSAPTEQSLRPQGTSQTTK